ncbi:DUF982 domain-containing protein [Rhizobiaceae sp. 2RAB30]
MDIKPFASPVRILLWPSTAIRLVRSAKEAAELLADIQWPGKRGPRHRDAVDTCLKVLDGHRSTVDARNAFIEAAREAHILAPE